MINKLTDYEINQTNSLKKAEQIIFSIFRKNTPDSKETVKKIHKEMILALKSGGRNFLQRTVSWTLINYVLSRGIQKGKSLYEIEQQLRALLIRSINKKSIEKPLMRRIERIFKYISPFITGENLLDYGAGSGLVSQLIAERNGIQVTLVDAIDYNVTSLPLLIIDQGSKIPAQDKSFDCSLSIVVLHHCDNLELALDELIRVTKKRIIIVEGFIDHPQQYIINVFFDWFMNRIGAMADINIPINFKTTDEWKKIFNAKKIKLIQVIDMGQEPTIREHHVLFVLDL